MVLATLFFRSNSTMVGSHHIVSISPYPLSVALLSLPFLTSIVIFFNRYFNLIYVGITFLSLLFPISLWSRDISRETIEGSRSVVVLEGFNIIIVLFIFREICFFLSFFWALLYSVGVPSVGMGYL